MLKTNQNNREIKRKLIRKNETQISWLQIIGFILMLLCVLYFIGKFIYNLLYTAKDVPALKLSADEVAILFFIIMLGFAFAFPDLLQDQNKGISTMRIVTYMMINVICMLLLKTGWDSKNLGDIKLDGYWMGIIAFVFGAKAVQSYFENTARQLNNYPKTDSYTNSKPVVNTGSQVATPPPGAINHPS